MLLILEKLFDTLVVPVILNCSEILGQVWYMIVSIPDLCTLTYLETILNDSEPFEYMYMKFLRDHGCAL